jgi:hypothetical protein
MGLAAFVYWPDLLPSRSKDTLRATIGQVESANVETG